MKLIPFKLSTLDQIIKALKQGGVIAHPADTCFGFTADPLNKNCVQKIQEIKGREKLKPMSIMIPEAKRELLEEWAVMTDFSKKLADQLLPGPVTLILPKGSAVPEYYFPETNLIGLRIPDHKPTQFILEAFDNPLITTSANPSGKPIVFDHQAIINYFEDHEHQPSLVVEGKLTEHHLASTVLKVEQDYVSILREGPITKKDLESMGIACR